MLYAAFETFGWRVCPTDKEGFLLVVNLGDDADTTGAVYGQLAGAYRAEAEQLVSQNVIPHKKYFGGSFPYAFTEQGVAMLSSVLNSNRAIKVNIEIMRAFVRLQGPGTGKQTFETRRGALWGKAARIPLRGI